MITPLYVDPRLGSGDTIHHRSIQRYAVECDLSAGDFMFSGYGPDDKVALIGIELKSIHDLLSSIDNGRLQGQGLPGSEGQLVKMRQSYTFSYLLTYGAYRSSTNGNIKILRSGRWFDPGKGPTPSAYLDKFLNTAAMAGVTHHHTYDKPSALYWIRSLYKWFNKPWTKHRSFMTLNTSGDKTPPMLQATIGAGLSRQDKECLILKIGLANQFPNMGFLKSLKCANHFKSSLQMINADIKDWMKIDGVGKTIATRIVEMLRREPSK